MTRALVLFVGLLGAGLPLWALGTYPVEDSFSRVLVAVILAGLVVGIVGLVRRASALDRRLAELGALSNDGVDVEKLEREAPALFRLVHARLRGERPRVERGEAMTRYLVSSLVLVGLLGTFVGLVDALVGARDALGVSSDVGALRSALLAPMKGLSRAFGTSVAGISASAMLGLAAVVVRRAELRLLDGVEGLVAGPLEAHTVEARQLAAFERLGAGLERGLASAAEGSDALFERAVTNATAVLEERAVALAKIFEDSAKERREAEQAWQASFVEQTRALLTTLDASLEKQAERWDAGANALSSSSTALGRFLEEQREGERALAAELRGVLEAQREGERALVAELQTFLTGQRESERLVVEELKAFTAGQREGERALVAEMRALVEEQKGNDRAALERVQAFLEESRSADRALVEEMRAFLRDEKGQALAFSDDIRGQLEGFLTKAAERDAARDEARLALEEKLTAERQALTSEVVTHLEAHAGAVRGQVSEMASSLSDGADALVAGGVELNALAERFASAVDSYKDATREWMDRLGALEINLSTGGADTERERFGAYLDQTREVFERSLELQRELFSGLKAAQGERAASEPASDDVVSSDGPVNQPNAEA